MITLGSVVREQIRRKGLWQFFREFWAIADPSCPGFVDNWHYGAIAEALTAVSRLEIRNLVINVPPGTGKSTSVDCLWPAWHWATVEPRDSFMSVSFDADLTNRNAERMINVLDSDLFREVFPALGNLPKVKAVSRFVNAKGGRRFSTSFEGKGTGWHCDIQVCDDPLKPKHATNAKALENVIDLWNGTFASRRVNPETFRRVIIMQRLAERDLAGVMLREHGYEHLCLPMRYVPKRWSRGLDPREEPETLLFPERFPETEVRRIERDLGTPGARAAQLQQDPTPDVGGLVSKAWLETVWTSLPKGIRLIQSWDFGFKGTSDGHSRVGGAIYGYHVGRVYFVAETPPKHVNFPESKRLFLETQRLPPWSNCDGIIIEDKANGSGIIQELTLCREHPGKSDFREEYKAVVRTLPPVFTACPKESKSDRLIRHTDFLESGGLLAPPAEVCPTVDEWRAEIVAFPRGSFDDRVDMLTQALDRLLGPGQRYAEALSQIQR